MITEDDKQRIREEEFFKYEVRRSFDKQDKKSIGSKVWSFFNSSFGLWLLSTVVVGLIVNSYTKFQEKANTKSRNEETQRKLETEVSNRIRTFKFELQKLMAAPDYGNSDVDFAVESMDAFANKDYAKVNKESNIFPEFRERTCESLIFEIEQTEADKKTKAALKQSRLTIDKIKKGLRGLPELRSEDGPFLDTTSISGRSKEERERDDSLINMLKQKSVRNNSTTKIGIREALQLLSSDAFLKNGLRIRRNYA